MKISSIVAMVAVVAAVSGCAGMISGTTQPVAVATLPIEGAQCKLINAAGSWTVTSPGSATIHKSKSSLDIYCTKNGYQDARISIRAHLNSLTFLGGPAGVGVDAATGADFKYPATVTVPMTPIGGAAPAGDPTVPPTTSPHS